MQISFDSIGFISCHKRILSNHHQMASSSFPFFWPNYQSIFFHSLSSLHTHRPCTLIWCHKMFVINFIRINLLILLWCSISSKFSVRTNCAVLDGSFYAWHFPNLNSYRLRSTQKHTLNPCTSYLVIVFESSHNQFNWDRTKKKERMETIFRFDHKIFARHRHKNTMQN